MEPQIQYFNPYASFFCFNRIFVCCLIQQLPGFAEVFRNPIVKIAVGKNNAFIVYTSCFLAMMLLLIWQNSMIDKYKEELKENRHLLLEAYERIERYRDHSDNQCSHNSSQKNELQAEINHLKKKRKRE